MDNLNYLLENHLNRETSDLSIRTNYQDTLALLRMDIKEEIDNNYNQGLETTEIKTESEPFQSDVPPNDSHNNPFENVQLEIKQEVNDNTTATLEHNADSRVNIQTENVQNIIQKATQVVIKEETQMDDSLVSYDYPNFDAVSMNSNETTDVGSIDSYDAAALGNVEACLQDEINIKRENDGNYDENEKLEYTHTNVKTESDLTLPGTHLTCNNVPATFTTGCPDGLPQNAVVRLPGNKNFSNDNELLSSYDTDNNSHLKPFQLNSITGDEQSFDEPNNVDNMESFQLNSITGNVLSLEQEAYCLLKAKKKKKIVTPEERPFLCPECPKTYRTKHSLKVHWGVHRTIERRAMGVLRGMQTRKENHLKKIEIESSESLPNTPDNGKVVTKKEGYECTCGKIFRRRSRMETCLRSHNLFETHPKCVSCMTCSKSFKNKDELSLHRKRLHRKRFPCKFCPTDYETRKELFKHLQIHQRVQLMEYKVISEVMKGKQKLRCFMCSKIWTELSELKSHVMIDHKEPYVCPHCKNTFTKIIDFGNHTKTYHPDVEGQSVFDVLEAFSKLIQAWKCQECGLQFLEADKLALHQIEKHSPELKSETQFQCTDCRRVFISQKGLTSHRRIHHSTESTEESKEVIQGIMCLECRKICKDITALTSHMRLHSPDRKYPCKFCDFRFATPEKRKTHAEIHTGDMRYVCFICEYQCSSENRLRQHKMSLKHANMKEYLLTGKPLLEEPESTSKEKKDSVKKKEGSSKKRKRDKEDSERKKDKFSSESEEVACDICGDMFSSESEMLEHKQTHPFIEFPNDDKPSRIFFK